MAVEREDLYGFVTSALICATPVAYLTFEFMLPNVSFPNFGKNLLITMLVSVLTGVPAGLMNKRTSMGIASVLVYSLVGYLVAFVFYMVPFVAYGASLTIPGLYYAAFLRFTIILMFLFIFGGIIGVVGGQYLRESTGREETKLMWGDERKE